MVVRSTTQHTIRSQKYTLVIAGSVAFGLGYALIAMTAPAHAAEPAWQVVKTYDHAGSAYDGVPGVTPLGPKNVWAFSGTDLGRPDLSKPLARRWNGTAWVGTALPSGLKGLLFDGDYSSASNVWAFGGADAIHSYVLKWNGTKWSLAKKWTTGQITGITVINERDVWVFGGPGADSGIGTWHYNGKSWTKVAAPLLIKQADKVSAKNIWAIGDKIGDFSDSRQIGRWNGTSWKSVSTGTAVPTDIREVEGKPWRYVWLSDVLARSSKDVWVSGGMTSGGPGLPIKNQPLLIHWNGTSWKRMPTPATGDYRHMAADGSGGLWFASTERSSTGAERQVMVRRTAAGTWSTAKVTGVGSRRPWLSDLDLVPGTVKLFGSGSLRTPDGASSIGAIFRYTG